VIEDTLVVDGVRRSWATRCSPKAPFEAENMRELVISRMAADAE